MQSYCEIKEFLEGLYFSTSECYGLDSVCRGLQRVPVWDAWFMSGHAGRWWHVERSRVIGSLPLRWMGIVLGTQIVSSTCPAPEVLWLPVSAYDLCSHRSACPICFGVLSRLALMLRPCA